MSRILSCLLALSLTLHLLGRPAAAGVNAWTSSGPRGGAVMSFAVAPSQPRTLYAWSSFGLWRSDDRGATWREIETENASSFALWLAVDPRDPETLYANRTGSEISRSQDGGESWLPFALSGADVRSFLIDPADPDRMYAGSPFIRGDGVSLWRSTDGGASWGAASRGLSRTGVGVERLAAVPGNPSTVWAIQNDRVWRSEDGGDSWQKRSAGLPAEEDDVSLLVLTVDPSDGDTVYVGDDFDRLWRTTTGGEFWLPMPRPPGAFFSDLRVDPEDRTKIHLLANDQILLSRDGGVSWASVLDGFLQSHRLAIDPTRPDVVYASFRGDPEDGVRGSLVRTLDGGETWRVIGLPTTSLEVATVPGEPGTVYAAGPDGAFRSTDGAVTWSGSVTERAALTSVVADASEPAVLYASASHFPPDRGVFTSSDGGETWSATTLETGIFELAADPLRPGVVYAFGGETSTVELWKTTDGGATWSELDTGGSIVTLAIDPAAPDVLYGVGFGAWKSEDGGLTWRDVSNGLPTAPSFGPPIDAVAIAPEAVYVASRDGIFHSEDGGESWQLLSTALLDEVASLIVDPRDPSTLYAGSIVRHRGVWRSLDGGLRWHRLGGGLEAHRVFSLAIDPAGPETLYAATDVGVFALTREPCVPDRTTLCIDDLPGDRRFRVRLALIGGGVRAAYAAATSLAPLGLDDGGVLSLFSPTNPEALVKVLDGCGINGRFWIFGATATDVGFELDVEDTLAAWKKTYVNPSGRKAPPINDIDGFATCEIRRREPQRPGAGAPSPPSAAVTVGACVPDATTLCLGDGRFRVRLRFDTEQGGGFRGDATAAPLAPLGLEDGGVMAFFSPTNPEMLVKVLDGCPLNDRFWVFAAAGTNVGYELVVEDLVGGRQRVYRNLDGESAETITDTDAFASCGF